MSHEHCTATTQSRAAAHAKLKKLMHKEPAVRVLLADNAKLTEERDAYAASDRIKTENLAHAKARIAELEKAKGVKPAIEAPAAVAEPATEPALEGVVSNDALADLEEREKAAAEASKPAAPAKPVPAPKRK